MLPNFDNASAKWRVSVVAGAVGLDAADDLSARASCVCIICAFFCVIRMWVLQLYEAAPLPESPILRYAGKPAKLPNVRTSA